MQCAQARQLFDAYLDGELSPALATELGAHRVRCPECRRALALLEVSGHIVASDRDRVALDGDFTDRLMACMEASGRRWTRRIGRTLYVAGPLAAAAVIALAFLGVFDGRGETKVAGVSVTTDVLEVPLSGPSVVSDTPVPESSETDDHSLEKLLERMHANIQAKRHSGQSLQQALDLKVLQLLEMLEKARDRSRHEEPFPGADDPGSPPSDTVPADPDGVEDL